MKKNTVKNIMYSMMISAAAVPVLGSLMHVMSSGAFQYNDAKLSHRFECAYSFNPNPEHKKFTSYQYVHRSVEDAWYDSEGNPMSDMAASVPTAQVVEDPEHPDYVKFVNQETYTENPFLTAFTYAGVAGLAYCGLRRRKKLAEHIKQQSR